MIMLGDKKKIATVILSKMKSDSSKDQPDFVQKIGEKSYEEKLVPNDKPEQDNSIALESAAEDMMEAFKKENPKMFLKAFMNLVELMDEEEDKSEKDESEEE